MIYIPINTQHAHIYTHTVYIHVYTYIFNIRSRNNAWKYFVWFTDSLSSFYSLQSTIDFCKFPKEAIIVFIKRNDLFLSIMKQFLVWDESFRMHLRPLTKLACCCQLANITLTAQLPGGYLANHHNSLENRRKQNRQSDLWTGTFKHVAHEENSQRLPLRVPFRFPSCKIEILGILDLDL